MTEVGVVIPAHNERDTIARLLRALAPAADDLEVVVVCNGCADDTAAQAARAAPWARVIELAIGSKPAALRAGDEAVGGYPRLYLDADVVLSADHVRRMAEVLRAGRWLAVAPRPRYRTDGAGWLVRSHYRIWTALYTDTNAVFGTGAIMLSAAGRQRFGAWPEVIADDYFVDGLFAEDEKRRLDDVEVEIQLPRTLRGCISRKARVHQGMLDVRRLGLRDGEVTGTGERGASLLALARRQPARIADIPGHLVVTFGARAASAWRRWRGSAGAFHRDQSSRR